MSLVRAVPVRSLVWPLVWNLVITAGGCVAAVQGGFGGVPLVVTAAALFLLTFPFLCYGFTQLDLAAALWCKRDRFALAKMVGFFVAMYLVYAAATGAFAWEAFGRYVAFVSAPTLICWWAGRGGGIKWQDWLAIFCVWIPFDSGWLSKIWSWPEGEGAYILNTSLAVTMAVTLFQAYRGHQGFKFRYAMSWADVRRIAVFFLGFLVLALPIGFATGFIGWQPKLEPARAVLTFFGLLFFVGIPEELLFRGLVQNLLEQKTKKPVVSLVVASVLFGATHLNNGEYPDWRYFLLATIAGVFYGWCFQRSRSIWVNATLHALVDVVWVTFFHIASGGAA